MAKRLRRGDDALPAGDDGAAVEERRVFIDDLDCARGSLPDHSAGIFSEDLARYRRGAEREVYLPVLGPARGADTLEGDGDARVSDPAFRWPLRAERTFDGRRERRVADDAGS